MCCVQHSHSAPVANVGLHGQCTSGARLLHVLDFPASLREQGSQGEGSRQDKVHRVLPCRGFVPETPSLWLKPKPLGNSCFSHTVTFSKQQQPSATQPDLAACAQKQTLADELSAGWGNRYNWFLWCSTEQQFLGADKTLLTLDAREIQLTSAF